MGTIKISRRMPAILVVITLSTLAAPCVKAQCRAVAKNGGTLAPEFRNSAEPTPEPDQGDSSAQIGSRPDKDDSEVTILGLWKNKYFSGGVLNDIGFRQFNGGGTELLNDSGVPGGGNNFCMGAWKRVGVRAYDLVHMFFVFDGAQPTGIAIEKSHIIVSRDGNTFRGEWTQDNYDFSGNVVPGFHSEGTVTGARIVPGIQSPVSFPF